VAKSKLFRKDTNRIKLHLRSN